MIVFNTFDEVKEEAHSIQIIDKESRIYTLDY